MQSVEDFIVNKPFQTLFFVALVLGVVFWVLSRLVGGDTAPFTQQPSQSEWREYKGKNGRID